MDCTDVTLGLDPSDIASLTGVDLTTARRWKRGRPIPEPARRLLRILTAGELEIFGREWRGWWLDAKNGVLCSPEQWAFRPSEILSLPFLHGMIASYQSQIRDMDARLAFAVQADWIEGRYVEPVSPKT